MKPQANESRTPVRPAPLRILAAITFPLIAAGIIGISAPPASAASSNDLLTDVVVPITETTSAAGFVHPGIGLTAANLEHARDQVRAGVQPWLGYYDAMATSSYASRTFAGDNVGAVVDQPANPAYNAVAMRGKQTNDSMRALTQTLMYTITGDEVYRTNAIKMLRIWGNMDPARYAYFADAHIHTGHPLYQMLMAAEIIRAIEPVNTSHDGYDIVWHDADSQKLVDNLAKPTLETFLFSNERYMNQHNFGLFGSIGTAIFTDDTALYNERVEWFTVNAGFDDYINGSVASLLPEIAADDPLNPLGTAFVQHKEMGRDQAHAEVDIVNFTGLARLVDNQGTRVDPVSGVVSSDADAVSPYRFLDDRILEGGDVFASFMMGNEVPWVDTTGGVGVISQEYRGRLYDTTSELYNQYKYRFGVDVEAVAPAISALHARSDGPLYYSGATASNFWAAGDNNPEYWVAFPPELAGQEVVPLPADTNVAFSNRSVLLDKRSSRKTEDGQQFVRVKASAEGSSVAVSRLMYGDRSGSFPVGLKIRTNGTAKLEIRKTTTGAPYATLSLPDTHWEWKYVSYDIGTSVLPPSLVGANLAFYMVVGHASTKVDFDHVNLLAKTQLSPPAFTAGATERVASVQGEPFSHAFAATDPSSGDTLTYRAADLPKGATLDSATGVLNWTPKAKQVGVHSFTVIAADGVTETVLDVTMTVGADRRAVYDAVLSDGYDPEHAYTTDSLAPFESAREAVEALLDDGDYTEFTEALATLKATVDDLKLLSPRLADGSLDYQGITSATVLTPTQIGSIADGDYTTHGGDLRVTSFTFDMGVDFRVSADAFGIQARYNFANRSEGTNVYGSIDGVGWALLTESPSTNTSATGFQLEKLPVFESLRDERFRFIKVQVDEPGVPTDPAYPGIWSIGEFRIFGDRSETVGTIETVSLTSPDSLGGRVTEGDTVSLSFSSSQPMSDVAVSIDGRSVTPESADAKNWAASVTLDGAVGAGTPTSFTIDHKTANGAQADTVAATTNGTALYESNEIDLIADVLAKSTVIELNGAVSTTKTTQAARLFDSELTSHTDTRAVDGKFHLIWDFGPDHIVLLSRADIIVRQDGYGTSRLSMMVLQGSNDLTTWKTLTPNVAGTLAWQNLPSNDSTKYRYLRLSNGNIIGVAELRLFGDYEARVD